MAAAPPPPTPPAPSPMPGGVAWPRLGVFLNVENPQGDARQALAHTIDTAVFAEAHGYADVWLAEHHYSDYAIGSAPGALLAQIAARTTRVRLGAGAALLPLNDPVRVAEEIATLDVLSGGRVEFGVARGGPFPVQYRQTGLASADEARARMLEGLDLVLRLWREPATDFEGRFYRHRGLSIYPRPLQQPMPVWLASLSEASLQRAAQEGYGLMATPSADLTAVARQVTAQRALRGDFAFAIARFFHCADDPQRARREGIAGVREYPRRMGVQFGPAGLPPMFAPDASEQTLLDNAVIGTPPECAARIAHLARVLGPHRLLLKPAVHDGDKDCAALAQLAAHLRMNPPA